MTLPQILCSLLVSVCTQVTAVEHSLGPTGASGAEKKTEALKGVGAFLDGLIAQGETFVRDHVEAVADRLIDGVVGAAHDIGAFTHRLTAPAPDGPPS